MNQQVRANSILPTTQVAEGLPRQRWTVAEIGHAARLGIFGEHERFELIGGAIVPVNAKGIRHEILKTALIRLCGKRVPDDVEYASATTFQLDEHSFGEPDFGFYPVADGLAERSPLTALRAVQVSDSSLLYDLGPSRSNT